MSPEASGLAPLPADVAASPADVAEALHHCVRRMKRLIEDRLGAHGLSLSRTMLLATLDRHGAVHQSALAATFELAPRTVTELVDGLERDGLVIRTPDPADRRARHVDLTPAGRALLTRAMATRNDVVEQVFGAMEGPALAAFAASVRLLDERIGAVSG